MCQISKLIRQRECFWISWLGRLPVTREAAGSSHVAPAIFAVAKPVICNDRFSQLF